MPYVHTTAADGAEIDALLDPAADGRMRIAAVDVRSAGGHHVTRPGQLSASERDAIAEAAGAVLVGEAGGVELVTTAEAADLLNVATSTVLEYVQRGVLPTRRKPMRGTSGLYARPVVQNLLRHLETGASAYDYEPGPRWT